VAVVGQAYVVINAITTGLADQIEKGLEKAAAGADKASGHVDSLSGSLERAFPNANKAAEAFADMNRKAYVMGTGLGVAAASISSLIGGIVALASAVASAAPAVVALAGTFAGLILGGIAAKIALGGVGAAVQKFNQQQEKGAKDTKASKRAIEDAYRSLARVIQSNKEQLVAADKAVANAAKQSTEAHRQYALAVKAGREELQQLGFDAEDAAIAEQKAAVQLDRARETLQRSQDLPPDSRARKEAELAYQEADLGYRRAKDKNADLAKEQTRLAKTGIDGIESVRSARISAEQADKAVEQAKISRSKTVRNGIIAQADAERAVARAKESAAGAGGNDDPFAKLTPSQKVFARYLTTLKPLMKDLRETVAKGFLPALQAGIERLVKDVFPTFKTGMGEIGTALGTAVTDFTNAVANPRAVTNFGTVLSTAANTIGKFGKIFGNLWKAAMEIFAAADPLIRKFTSFLEKKTGAFANFLDTKGKTGELQTFFTEAGRIAGEIGKIIGNVASGLGNIIKANTGPGTGGQIMLDYFKDITGAFKAFSGSSTGQSKMKDYFAASAENTKAILDTVGAFVKEFLKLGADPNTKVFWTTIKEAAPILGDIFKELNKGGPAAATLLVNLAKMVRNLLDSGAATMFFKTLNIVVVGLNKILENKMVKTVLKWSGAIHGVVFALGLVAQGVIFMSNVFMGALLKIFAVVGRLLTAFKFIARYILGPIVRAIGFLANKILTLLVRAVELLARGLINLAKGAIRMVITGLNLLRAAAMANPMVAIAVAVVALIAAMIILYKKNEKFREIIDKIGRFAKRVFEGIIDVVKKVIDWVKTNWPLVLAIITGPIGLAVLAVTKNWDKIKEYVSTAIDKIVEIGKKLWGWILSGIKWYWNLVVTYWTTIFEWIGKLGGVVAAKAGAIWSFIKESLSTAWENTKSVFTTVLMWVGGLGARVAEKAKGMWNGIKDAFKGAINWIIAKWNDFKLEAKVPASWLADQLHLTGKGFTMDTPDIPLLAQGGTVMPTAGGTLVRVAEAGRPERIEPLDRQGLSRRDKALIRELSGGISTGSAGPSIVVNPSPGMNEIEIAHLVSRRVAFNMRRGT